MPTSRTRWPGWRCPSAERARRSPTSARARAFPASSLAVALPDATVALVESVGKKCAFLRRAARAWGSRTSRSSRPRRGLAGRHRHAGRRHGARAGAAGRARRVRRAAAARAAGRSSPGRAAAMRQRRPRRAAAAMLGLERPGPCAVDAVPGRGERHLHVYLKVGPTPDGLPPSRGNGPQTATRRLRLDGAGDASAPNRAAVRPRRRYRDAPNGHRLRDREPEGRGRQDDHRRQRRRLHRRGRLPTLLVDIDPQGNATVGLGLAQGRRAERLRRALRRRRRAPTPSGRPRSSASRSCLDAGPRGRQRRAAAPAPAPSAGCATRWRRSASATPSPARLPAVARAADRQRAGGRRPGDRPGADRVLRARGPGRAARHAGAHPARAQPAADGRRACC